MCMHNCEVCGKCPGREGKPMKIASGFCAICSLQYENGEPACLKCGRPLPWPPGTRRKQIEDTMSAT